MSQLLVCPFSSRPLELLSQEELAKINARIERGELFFQRGVPLGFPLKKVYISSNRVYLYAEIEGILLLKRRTAIVEKNQVENPMIRITDGEISDFYQNLGLGKDGSFLPSGTDLPAEPNLGADVLRSLFAKINKQGHCLVTMASAEVDELHNLVFGLDYQSHIHMDHNPDRLRHINGKLEANTQYVLCDPETMPFEPQSVDGYFSFNLIEAVSKETQKAIWLSLKAVLKPAANSVCLVDEHEKNHLEAFYKSDLRSAKLKPWKKSDLPQLYFHKTRYAGGDVSASISDKRSFGSQFSKA